MLVPLNLPAIVAFDNCSRKFRDRAASYQHLTWSCLRNSSWCYSLLGLSNQNSAREAKEEVLSFLFFQGSVAVGLRCVLRDRAGCAAWLSHTQVQAAAVGSAQVQCAEGTQLLSSFGGQYGLSRLCSQPVWQWILKRAGCLVWISHLLFWW